MTQVIDGEKIDQSHKSWIATDRSPTVFYNYRTAPEIQGENLYPRASHWPIWSKFECKLQIGPQFQKPIITELGFINIRLESNAKVFRFK